MALQRDNFSEKIKTTLAKRVGYRCSNPDCEKPTVGAHSDLEKSALIGEGAHITGASKGGPRYDDSLTHFQRGSIENGIWLCSNCATLIDKDEMLYPPLLLKKWKIDAEYRSATELGRSGVGQKQEKAFIDIDLEYRGSGHANKGLSNKTPVKQNGIYRDVLVPVIQATFWYEVHWCYNLIIINNSKYAAYNVQIENDGPLKVNGLKKLSEVNNLAPLDKINQEVQTSIFFEGTVGETQEFAKVRYPSHLNNIKLKLSYEDDSKNKHYVILKYQDGKKLVTRFS